MGKIRVECSKAQYERLVQSMMHYFEDGKCVLGRCYYACPSIQKDSTLTCDACIRRNLILIKRGDNDACY